MLKGVTHVHVGPIWYHSEPSDVPIAQTSFLVGTFFYRFLQQTSSSVDDASHYHDVAQMRFHKVSRPIVPAIVAGAARAPMVYLAGLRLSYRVLMASSWSSKA